MQERVKKIKTHIRENKKVYTTGAVCFVFGAAVVIFTK